MSRTAASCSWCSFLACSSAACSADVSDDSNCADSIADIASIAIDLVAALHALQGAGARVELDGAFLVDGKRHCDNTTIITHAVPDTTSHQAFRGVLAGAAQAAYQGCVKVRPDAQHTDAHQMSRALLLSETARIATKPELEIFADDVKCSHGATAGELDAQALFFLRARGIPLAEARAMLIEAFLQEPLEAIADAPLRRLASAAITAWLATQSGEA